MLLYTSGATSGSPRGVTLSHSILGKQVHIVQSWLISVILSVPDLHVQNLQPADRAGCRRLGLDFGGQCASLHRPRVNLWTHQLTAGDLSPDFLLFGGWFRFFLFLKVSCISFSGSSLNGCKNNPHAPVRPTQGECLLIFFNDNDDKNRKMFE